MTSIIRCAHTLEDIDLATVALPAARSAPRAALSLTGRPVTAWSWRAALLIVFLLVATTALSLPVYLRQAPESGPLLTTWATLACGADLLTAFLLIGQLGGTRSPSLAVLAAVYLLSGLMVLAHVLTFPGVFAPAGLLHAGSQTAAWLWSLWHAAFMVGLAIYVLVDDRAGDIRLSRVAARRLLLCLLLGVVASVGLVTLSTIVFASHLPVIMDGDVRHAALVRPISRGT
ncbi:MAG TPA: MASE4 domain-containing protein, partial [Chloroflexota bacterium]|nr:MASE4 domain-containing protein [Chloroflexota bacterium]